MSEERDCMQQQVETSCLQIIDTTLASVDRYIGAAADEFDRGMPCYCALATFVTFVSLIVREENQFRPLLNCVLSFAERADIEHRGLMAMLASQRVDYSKRSLSKELAQEITDQLTSLEPPHAAVFADAVAIAFLEASKNFVKPIATNS
jgi:hypothetical protein